MMNNPYKHQEVALQRYRYSSEIPLFFDPGTGKSRTTLLIAADKYKRGEIDALLVIAPNGVHRQWATEEIPKWMSDIDTTVQWRKNKKLFFVEGRLNIVCTNIEQFSTKTRYMDYTEWANSHKTMLVLDEATRIKNPKAIRTQRLLYEFNTVVKRGKTILSSTPKTVARAILTGTPVTNGPFDVWAMFEFLRPGYFGINWFMFQNKYGMFHAIQVNGRVIRILINEQAWTDIRACDTFEMANALYGVSLGTYDTIKNQDHYEGPFRNVEQLRDQMLEIAMFVRIEDCIDMPERTYNRKLLDMSAEQARVYYELEKYFVSLYHNEKVEAKSKLTAYIRLQQIASGFVSSEQLPEDEVEDPPPNKITWFDELPKMDQLLVDVEEIVGSTDNPTGQCIIVCHFSAEAERIFDTLENAGYKCCLQTGWKKVGTLEAFKAKKYPILVANIRVISMGFNLQEHCHHMIFYSNTFSLEDRIQVEARIYRAGQKQTCIYLDYVMKDTIDMKVYAALKQKKQLADYIRDTSVEDMLTKPDEVFENEYTITYADGEEVIF
jgi:SNF2 family DNA or RNA helicase